MTQGTDKEQVIEKLKKNGNRTPGYLIKVLDDLCSLIKRTKELVPKEIEALNIPVEICFHPISSHFFFHSGLYFQVKNLCLGGVLN